MTRSPIPVAMTKAQASDFHRKEKVLLRKSVFPLLCWVAAWTAFAYGLLYALAEIGIGDPNFAFAGPATPIFLAAAPWMILYGFMGLKFLNVSKTPRNKKVEHYFFMVCFLMLSVYILLAYPTGGNIARLPQTTPGWLTELAKVVLGFLFFAGMRYLNDVFYTSKLGPDPCCANGCGLILYNGHLERLLSSTRGTCERCGGSAFLP